MTKIIIFFAMLMLFAACTKTTEDQIISSDIPVVESFLTPGETPMVKLTKMILFSEEGSDGAIPISNSDVSLIHNDTNYLLVPVEGKPGVYYYDGNELSVLSGENYRLEFLYNDSLVYGETTIPWKPEGFHASTTTIEMVRITENSGMGGVFPGFTTIELTWDDPDYSYYLLKTEYLEEEYDPVNEMMEIENPEELAVFTTDPIQENIHTLRGMQFRFFGTYRIVLFRITPAYAELFESLSQSSLEGLAEAESNIINGKGVFAAYHSDTLQIEVVEAK